MRLRRWAAVVVALTVAIKSLNLLALRLIVSRYHLFPLTLVDASHPVFGNVWVAPTLSCEENSNG
jgi:hypothetical protein